MLGEAIIHGTKRRGGRAICEAPHAAMFLASIYIGEVTCSECRAWMGTETHFAHRRHGPPACGSVGNLSTPRFENVSCERCREARPADREPAVVADEDGLFPGEHLGDAADAALLRGRIARATRRSRRGVLGRALFSAALVAGIGLTLVALRSPDAADIPLGAPPPEAWRADGGALSRHGGVAVFDGARAWQFDRLDSVTGLRPVGPGAVALVDSADYILAVIPADERLVTGRVVRSGGRVEVLPVLARRP